MPPRRRKAVASSHPRSTRGTQPPAEHSRSRSGSPNDGGSGSEREEDESEIEETEFDTQSRPRKKSRIERVDTPATAYKWIEQGLFDLPAIPNYDAEEDEEDDDERRGRADNAALMVVAILLQHHKKEPFTNNQLKNQVGKAGMKDDFDGALKTARKLLYTDFGCILAEISPSKPFFPMGMASDIDIGDMEGGAEQDGSDGEDGENTQKTAKGRRTRTRSFVLVSTMKPDLSFVNCGSRAYAYQRDGDALAAARLTVLSLTLLYLFMEGGEASEEVLWTFLKPYGFNVDNTGVSNKLLNTGAAGATGNLRTLVNSTFVKQQYIIKHHTQIVPGDSTELVYYRWGPRADLEFSRLALVEMCAKVFGVKADMESFGERFANAEATEKRRLAKLQSFVRNL